MGFNQAPALPYRNLGIAQDGDAASRAISKGKYVIWKGKNYFAKTDILQGETFVEDTNLTEIPDGALNGIADALNASLKPFFLDPANITSIERPYTYTVQEDCYMQYLVVGSRPYYLKIDDVDVAVANGSSASNITITHASGFVKAGSIISGESAGSLVLIGLK